MESAAIDVREPLLVGIYYAQLILIFVTGILFLFGIFMFIYAFKNPMRRRLAYVCTVIGACGFILILFGPVFILYYVFDQPAAPNPELGLYFLVPGLETAKVGVYEAIVRIVQPLLVLVFLIGVGVLHHASKIPNRRRIGYGVFLGVPILWVLMQIGPSIVRLLTS
jgi:hypothetical protein